MNAPEDRAAARIEAVNKLYVEARKLGLLCRPDVQMYCSSLVRQFDPHYFRILYEIVERAKRAELLCPKPLQKYLPTEEEARGEITLGKVVGNEYSYGVNTSERHFLVLGSTGYGKSTFCRKIQKHLILNGQPCFIFSKKKDNRSIASHFHDKVVLFRVADNHFKFNPKQGGPGVSLLGSNTDFCETFCQAEALLLGSGNYILNALTELDVILKTDQNIARQASIFEIRDYIARKSHIAVSRDARFRESILNRLDGLISSLGPAFECSQGFPIEQALNDGMSIVLEVDGVKEEIALLVTTSIMLRLFSWMLHSTASKPESLNIFLDDSQEIWNVNMERRSDEGLPIMGVMASRFRVAGLIVATTQTPRLTSTMLRQNCGTKVIFNQGDHDEALSAARSIGLPDSEACEIQRLGKGEAVCFKPSYPYPVKVKIERDPELVEER
jgi:hypothetical protein